MPSTTPLFSSRYSKRIHSTVREHILCAYFRGFSLKTRRDGQGKWLVAVGGQKEMGKASGCTFQNSVCIFLEKTTVKKNLKTTTGGAGGVGADV